VTELFDLNPELPMAQGIMTMIYPVKDLAHAKTVYGALAGATPTTDSPYYVGFQVGDQEIGLDPNGHTNGLTGPVGYWHVSDIRRSLSRLLDAGATIVQEVRDVGRGRLIAVAKDGDGNAIGLLQDS
jgi:predicted enzyme related to lactoylglutathione lyase